MRGHWVGGWVCLCTGGLRCALGLSAGPSGGGVGASRWGLAPCCMALLVQQAILASAAAASNWPGSALHCAALLACILSYGHDVHSQLLQPRRSGSAALL